MANESNTVQLIFSAFSGKNIIKKIGLLSLKKSKKI
jgi:hypothetical protein